MLLELAEERAAGEAKSAGGFGLVAADTPELLEVVHLYLDLLKRGVLLKTPDGQPLFETYQQAKNDTVFESQGAYRIPTLLQRGAPPFGTVSFPVHPARRRIATDSGGYSAFLFKDVPPPQRRAAARTGVSSVVVMVVPSPSHGRPRNGHAAMKRHGRTTRQGPRRTITRYG